MIKSQACQELGSKKEFCHYFCLGTCRRTKNQRRGLERTLPIKVVVWQQNKQKI